MTTFEVWAPEKRVRLRTQGQDREMTRREDGWWELDVPEAGPGTDYAYLLDEQETPHCSCRPAPGGTCSPARGWSPPPAGSR